MTGAQILGLILLGAIFAVVLIDLLIDVVDRRRTLRRWRERENRRGR